MSIVELSMNLAQETPYGNNLHYCNICPFFTTSNAIFINHTKDHGSSFTHFNCENAIENYYCKDCDFNTNLTIFINQHRKKYHRNQLNDQEDFTKEYYTRSYICENCSFETYFLLTWLQHSAACDGKRENVLISSQVSTHVSRLLKDKSLYQCGKCSYIAEDKSCLKKHIYIKHLDEKVRKWYNWEHSYSKHLVEKGIQWYQCGGCLYKTESKDSLETHIYLVHQQLECNQCSYKTMCQTTLKNHMNHAHGNESKLYQCEKCPFKKKAVWYSCARCSLKTKSARTMQYHIHARQATDNIVKLYQCEKCSYIAANARTYKNHVNTFDSDVLYNCQQCPFRSKYRSSLQYHMFSKHSRGTTIKWHQCENCSYKSRWISALRSHMNTFHPAVRHNCNHCPFNTSCLQNLRIHKFYNHEIAIGVRWYQCGKCTHKAESRRSLLLHSKVCSSVIKRVV